MIDWRALIPVLFFLSEWAIRIGMTPVVMRNRRSSNALAWLAGIYFIPWIGLFLYLLVGQRHLGRRRQGRYADAKSRIESPSFQALYEPHVVHPKVPAEQDDLVLLCERLSGLPIVGGNSVEFLSGANDMIEALVADIDRAEQHVHVLFYIFQDDATGRRVAHALAKAAARGVRCRVLADSVGSKLLFQSLAAELRSAGVEVSEALPSGILRRRFRRIDLRNHRKLAVIDGKIGYTGSQNIVDAHYGHKRVGAWRDLTLRIVGPAVHGLQIVFLEDWCAESGVALEEDGLFPSPDTSGDIPVHIVPSGPNDVADTFRNVTIAAINESQSRILMTTPYFIPDESLLLSLHLAVLRGVRVDLIIPDRCDQRIVGAAAQAYYKPLLEAGVHVHLHQDGLLHAKTLCVDESFAMIGSGNLDFRSFFLNFELSVLLYGEPITRKLRVEQERYIAQSRLLDADAWGRESFVLNLTRNLAALFSPLL